MVQLRYPYAGYFTDHERGERYEGPCEADIPEEKVEHYLTRRWERVEEDDEDEEDGDGDDDDESEEFDQDEEVTDRDELEEMSYDELRSMASESDREDVNGRMRMDDIIDAFAEN